jgi:hypothetical protein
MTNTSRPRLILFFLITLCCAPASWAGVGTSLHQDAPVLKPGDFEASLHTDIIFNRGGGFNLSPHIRAGVIEHFLDVDAYIGMGTTDFQIGALGKYNLLPDLKDQVGLSFLGGFGFIRDEGSSAFLLSTGVLVSKQVELNIGRLSPYGALQLEFLFGDATTVPLTLLAGAKLNPIELKQWNFYSELSVNLHESFWGLSFGAGYPF